MVSKIQSGLVSIMLLHVDEKLLFGTLEHLRRNSKKLLLLFRLTKQHVLKFKV